MPQMPNDAVAEKAGSAEHSDGALLGRRHAQTRPHVFERTLPDHWVTWTAGLLVAFHDVSYFVQMGIDFVRDLAEVAPFTGTGRALGRS